MLNTLLRLKAGSPRKPDLMRFFSPIWIHICTCGFSTESNLSCPAGLTESPLRGVHTDRAASLSPEPYPVMASCTIANGLGPAQRETIEVQKVWKFLSVGLKKKKIPNTNKQKPYTISHQNNGLCSCPQVQETSGRGSYHLLLPATDLVRLSAAEGRERRGLGWPGLEQAPPNAGKENFCQSHSLSSFGKQVPCATDGKIETGKSPATCLGSAALEQ